jgi:DNA-binding GntR family transcriptional regulator
MELTRATYQFRSIVETAAIATFAQTATDQEIGKMADRHHSVIARIEKGGLTKAVLLELETLEDLLHGSIVSSLQNPLIEANHRRVRNYVRLIGLDRRLTPPLALKSMGEHLAIIEACRRRNIEASVGALRAHFSAALQRSIGLY